jgi:hypothetical protein
MGHGFQFAFCMFTRPGILFSDPFCGHFPRENAGMIPFLWLSGTPNIHNKPMGFGHYSYIDIISYRLRRYIHIQSYTLQ